MKISSLVLPSIALGAATLLIIPGASLEAFTFTGAILPLNQRDFRVRNNFADAATNNNNTPASMYPGALGVFQATWKGVAEWGSEMHGDGTGDPTQGVVGNGGANFDGFWAGLSTGVGSVGDNVISATTGCSSGVIAFAESTASSGWRIRFCDGNFTFADGPGSVGGQIDFQSILAHEYGHALGLGHSATNGATMFASYAGGTAERSIANDDIAGVQAPSATLRLPLQGNIGRLFLFVGHVRSSYALYSKLGIEGCLIHVDTEGPSAQQGVGGLCRRGKFLQGGF